MKFEQGETVVLDVRGLIYSILHLVLCELIGIVWYHDGMTLAVKMEEFLTSSPKVCGSAKGEI